jgi:glucokinase
MEYTVKFYNKDLLTQSFPSYVLGVDIGGTNTNCGIAGVKNSIPNLIFSLNFKSQELNSLIPVIQQVLSYAKESYDIKVTSGCIGAAGVVSPYRDYVTLTNVEWNVHKSELLQETLLQHIYLINDFQTIGYGLNLLDVEKSEDIFQVRSRQYELGLSHPTKVIIGAGTGLGKTILTYDKLFDVYIPLPSEGGHADFPAHNTFEMQLVESIKKSRGITSLIGYEEVLSGRGLEGIYSFLRDIHKFDDTDFTKEIDRSTNKASLISSYKEVDETCKETFRLFTRFYARCAKNFVLDTFATGGLYFAGGIAVKNKDIFTSNEFFEEFEHADQRSDFLRIIPINVIMNYDVSLYGACFAAMFI